MSIRWKSKPRAQFSGAIRYLTARNKAAANALRDDVRNAVKRLEEHPEIGRNSNYSNLRAWSLPKWHKIIVYRITEGGVEIVALLDTRKKPPETID